MSAWEPSIGGSDDWYTPKHVFDAIGEQFDLDVAATACGWAVPAKCRLTERDDGLKYAPFWHGFVWMNPPVGGRMGLVPWLECFFAHGNGIALTPDRTSAPWWQDAAARADAILLTRGKIKFEKPDGSVGKSPGSGVTLWAAGERAVLALLRAEVAGLGSVWTRRARETRKVAS